VIREELLGTAIIVLSADVEVDEAMDLPAGGWYTGMLVAAAGMAWLTRIGVHSGYAPTAAGAVVCGTLLRRGPLVRQAEAAPPGVKAQQHESALPARP
jgi:hypothetical protein